jgi:hypothetical protein
LHTFSLDPTTLVDASSAVHYVGYRLVSALDSEKCSV